MSGNHTNTRDSQLKILEMNGYRRIRNTSIFKSECKIVLSPAVSKNSNGTYWFDVRQAILDREIVIDTCLIRIVPDKYIVLKMIELKTILNAPYKCEDSGNVTWGFELDPIKQIIFNKKDKSLNLKVTVVDEYTIGEL